MAVRPQASTRVAELVSTATSHVVAALVFLNHKSALSAPSKVEPIFQKIDSIVVTDSPVVRHHAL